MTPKKVALFGFCIFHTLPACSFTQILPFYHCPKLPAALQENLHELHISRTFSQVEGGRLPCLLSLFLHAVVYMGPRASMLYYYEDPWRVSAFSFVFTQLLLTVLVLVHTILVCITFQLMKWYGWWIPSRRDSVYRQDGLIRYGMCAAEKPCDLDSKASKSSPLINTERFLKRSRSEDWRSAKSKSLVCPKCHGVCTFKQGPPSKNDRPMSPQWGETPRCSDGANSRGSHVEGGFRVRNANEESVNNTNTPIDTRKLSPMVVNEDGMCTDRVVAEAGSSSKVLMADGEDRVSHKNVSEEMTNYKLETSEIAWCIGKEMQEEVGEEELSAVTKGRVHESNDHGSDKTIKGSEDEDCFIIMAKKGDDNGYDSESVIKGLRQAIHKERQKLCALYGELEVERIASETATNEAMSMISRLQEEKAALHMQSAHFQRMAEEKANFDEQAMQLLKEMLYRKERENYLLEKEVKVMRTRVYRNVRRYGKKRPDAERRSFFVKSEETLLLKNVEEVSNQSEGHVVQEQGNVGAIASVEKAPYPCQIKEEQPLKRLKSVNDHENGTIQSSFLVADSVHFASAEGFQNAYIPQQSGIATPSSDSAVFFEFGLRKQMCEKMANVFENGENFEELSVPLESARSTSFAVDSELESYYFVATSKENQTLLTQDSEEAQTLLHDVSKAEEAWKPGDRFLQEVGVCTDKRTSEFITTCSLDGVAAMMSGCKASTSVMTCPSNGQETGDMAARKDLQTRLQIFESDMMSRSCPSLLNNKGSGMNKFEEKDSTFIRSPVH